LPGSRRKGGVKIGLETSLHFTRCEVCERSINA